MTGAPLHQADAAGNLAAAPGVPAAFELTRTEAGAQIAGNGVATLSLLDVDGRVFRRRAVKGVGGPSPQPVEWAVAELDGVRVYFDGTHVVVTRQDLMP